MVSKRATLVEIWNCRVHVGSGCGHIWGAARGDKGVGGEEMTNDPRLIRLAARLACVALVVSIMFPLGRMVFPYVAEELGTMQFSALEAVLSTTVGFGIYTAFFG